MDGSGIPGRLFPWQREQPLGSALSSVSGRPDPNEFGAIEKALNEAAGRLRNLWISYLLLSTYLMISVGSVTHRMLFLETPIRLPVLNVDLPLNGFFFVAPIIYLIFHVYLLLQLSLLAQRARDYNEAVGAFGFEKKDENRLRQRIDSSVILQFIAGPEHDEYKRLGAMLALIAWVTMAVVPVLLLIFMQLQYLPYHHPWITWLHRVCVILDLVFLWAYWGEISRGRAILPKLRSLGRVFNVGATFVVPIFVLCFAVYPGEAMHSFTKNGLAVSVLFERNTDDVEGGTAGWLANRIIVPDQDFVDDKVLSDIRKQENDDGTNLQPGEFKIANSFRGRDFRGAVLDRADLRRSDLTGAKLDGASLIKARLDRSKLDCADTRRIAGAADERMAEEKKNDFACVSLAGAALTGVHMELVSIRGTLHKYNGRIKRHDRGDQPDLDYIDETAISRPDMRGVEFDGAHLPGAVMTYSEFENASFNGARLQGAVLNEARLQGVSFNDAKLQGASLNKALLQGSSLNNTKLHGADLIEIQLQAASLIGTQLFGAVLDRADIRGAYLHHVQLQGASLFSADLRGAFFDELFVWRATGLETARFGHSKIDKIQTGPQWSLMEETDQVRAGFSFGELGYENLKKQAVEGVLDDTVRQLTLRRLAILTSDQQFQKDVADLALLHENDKNYNRDVHAKMLGELACDRKSTPHVADGLIQNFVYPKYHGRSVPFARQIIQSLDDNTCPGAAGLEYDTEIRMLASEETTQNYSP